MTFPSELDNTVKLEDPDALHDRLFVKKEELDADSYKDLVFKPKPVKRTRTKYRPPNGTILNLDGCATLKSLNDTYDYDDVLFMCQALSKSKKIVTITGAGVSVESGIPDFRSANGLFQGFASKSNGSGKNLFDYNVFRSSESIKEFENMIHKLYILSNNCQPSPFHLMLDKISHQGRLLRLYTQNIDCLDTQLPNLQTKVPLAFKKPYPKTIQLHGNINLVNCSKCHYVKELDKSFFDENRTVIQNCPECEELNAVRAIAGRRAQSGGVLRPRIVLYNEFHPDGEIIGNITESDLKSRPDCLLVVGTTLKIPGVRRLVKEMAKVVHYNKGSVIWVNVDQPSQSIVDYVEHFDLIVTGSCQILPSLLEEYEALQPKKRQRKPKEAGPKNQSQSTSSSGISTSS
ncbi:hypothetical protein OGAPHI_003790 [Ogataea philodendri]|uniref:Deacetylase sirtuin-type domain-containing protein n=1 Tax=Ogataea philodendri TaxID=1378263 RepID=A0A9P8P5E9_9ASCO|nr:uncharacterized protein OGAPHI_003790 [Ogataea philodendri]KAH3665602.1 hypothetical protein OGAPHI_003790 [Ogataea philodendri]